VYLILAILLPVVVLLAMPAILNAIHYFTNLDYQEILQNIIAWLHTTLNSIKELQLPTEILNLYVNQAVDSILKALDQATIAQPEPVSINTIFQSLSAALSTTFSTATGVVSSLMSSLALLVFTFLASIYISLDARSFHDAILRAIPERFRPEFTNLIARLERIWIAFIRGQLTLMLFIGIVTWLGLTILGVSGAPYLGITAGLLEIIPNLGPILAAVPAVIVALLQESTTLPNSPIFLALLVILFYCLLHLFEANLVVPKVLGQAMNLPSLVVMTGVLIGAEVGGLLGILLAAPVIASIRDIVLYVYHKILGETPFPPESDKQTQTPSPHNRLENWRTRALQIFQRKSKGSHSGLPTPEGTPEMSLMAKENRGSVKKKSKARILIMEVRTEGPLPK